MRKAVILTLIIIALLLGSSGGLGAGRAYGQATTAAAAKVEFEVIEGIFHDGLGTYAELTLANELIAQSGTKQPLFETTRSELKMSRAIERLPIGHPARNVFQKEIGNMRTAAKKGAAQLLIAAGGHRVTNVRHTPREYAGAKAGDVSLELAGGARLPISVKTDKSGKVAVAEGQTPYIGAKWAERYFGISEAELHRLMSQLGFHAMEELKSDYLNVSALVARVLITSLGLEKCRVNDFSKAQVTNLNAAKHLFRQLLRYKNGNDRSRVIIFDRSSGNVKWESRLEAVDVERLTADRISFSPARPRSGHPVATEFGIRIDGRTVVSFQVKHKRGRARGSSEQYRFSDITTRLRL